MSSASPWNGSPLTLLAERAWAERLARRLVRDPARAEDLAQEAWVRAVQRPPDAGLRAWLGGVVRNLASQSLRESARRRRREERAARAEALPSTSEALERMALQEELLHRVLALEEPYRAVIVARFYEGLPPRRIAARLGVPVSTVKTRLTRALARLRAELDRSHGSDGRSWALALLPLARGTWLPWLAGPLLMHSSLKIALATSAVVGLALIGASRLRPQPRGTEPVPEAPAAAAERSPSPLAVPELASARREASAEPAQAPIVPMVEERVHGRVVDVSGLPVVGVELTLRGSRGVHIENGRGSCSWDEPLSTSGEPLAISGAGGNFDFVRPRDRSGRLVSRDPRFETVLAPHCTSERELLLVVAPLFRLSGHVIDASGRSLEGVGLTFRVPFGPIATLGLDLSSSNSNGWDARSDALGRFTFERLPQVPGATLEARLEPYLKREVERVQWVDEELEIVLEEPRSAWLEGCVVARGAPVPQATVVLGYHATTTDESGNFRLALGGMEGEEHLCAIAEGYLPARMIGDRDREGAVRWPAFVRLVLEDSPLELRGRVVDAEDQPLANQEVWLDDPTIAYTVDMGFPVLLEALIDGKAEMRKGTKTDEDGGFVLHGLEARDYRLRIVDPVTAILFDAGPYAAGSDDVLVRRSAELAWTLVRGVLVDRAGEPVVGASVTISTTAAMVGREDVGPFFSFEAHGARAVSGADGSFELHDVPRGAELHVNGLGLSDPELSLADTSDPERLRVTVGRIVKLHVHVADARRGASAFQVLDVLGQPTRLQVPTDSGVSISTWVQLRDGASPITTLDESGVELVLYAGAVELERMPLHLAPGVVNSIDL